MSTIIDDRIENLKTENRAAMMLLKQNMNRLDTANIKDLFIPLPSQKPKPASSLHSHKSNNLDEIVKLSSAFLSKTQVRNLALLVDSYNRISNLFYAKS